MAKMKLSELAKTLGGQLDGDGERTIRGVATIESAGPDELTFLANKRYEQHMPTTRAAAVIVAEDYAGPKPDAAALLRCRDAYFAFRQAMVAFYGFRRPGFDGVSPLAGIDASAKLADGVDVGQFVTVAAGCEVGAGTVLYPGVYVGANCCIGRDCTLHPNVTLYDGSVLGDRVTVHASSSIGVDGFGYATHAGRHEKIPSAGRVELEDDVEIGSCCAIQRATLGATIIGAGTKFADLVAIGHGTKMGKGCLMVSQAGIAGSVSVGDYCVFAGQSGVIGHIRISDGVKVAAQSGVTGDITSAMEIGGSPAVPLPQARRVWMTLARIPQMRSTLRRLTREVAAIKHRLGAEDGGSKGDGC
ncbi:MAG: UDP-3-O-(3-hydroxymyristoyl)glucosamine N-acyltransferase [Planctomycetota bacterium]|nr:UDP-3-O-(3-hydroxymyristoyl)glucosamine N-acyltransferase [Planctomycetota bacterium]